MLMLLASGIVQLTKALHLAFEVLGLKLMPEVYRLVQKFEARLQCSLFRSVMFLLARSRLWNMQLEASAVLFEKFRVRVREVMVERVSVRVMVTVPWATRAFSGPRLPVWVSWTSD